MSLRAVSLRAASTAFKVSTYLGRYLNAVSPMCECTDKLAAGDVSHDTTCTFQARIRPSQVGGARLHSYRYMIGMPYILPPTERATELYVQIQHTNAVQCAEVGR